MSVTSASAVLISVGWGISGTREGRQSLSFKHFRLMGIFLCKITRYSQQIKRMDGFSQGHFFDNNFWPACFIFSSLHVLLPTLFSWILKKTWRRMFDTKYYKWLVAALWLSRWNGLENHKKLLCPHTTGIWNAPERSNTILNVSPRQRKRQLSQCLLISKADVTEMVCIYPNTTDKPQQNCHPKCTDQSARLFHYLPYTKLPVDAMAQMSRFSDETWIPKGRSLISNNV
jgi:hypothetical protein